MEDRVCMVAFPCQPVKSPFLSSREGGAVEPSRAGAFVILVVLLSSVCLNCPAQEGEATGETQESGEAEERTAREDREDSAADAESRRLAGIAAGRELTQSMDHEKLRGAGRADVELHVSLGERVLEVLVDREVAIRCPVCCGRSGSETEVGEFTVDYISEQAPKDCKYGSLIDAKGNLVLKGVYSDRDPIPVGANFVPSPPNISIVLKEGPLIHSGDANGTASTCGAIVIPTTAARSLKNVIRRGAKVRITK